jgi:hypothetical protein
LRWSGPVAFRKHAPGLAERVVSAPRGWLGRNMDDLSGSGKMIIGYLRFCAVRCRARHFEFGIHLLFALLFGVISLLYATVGQAGGTAFLALMAFAVAECKAGHRLRNAAHGWRRFF